MEENMAKDICKGCQTRLTPTMKCNRNCCAMAEVVAENLCNIGYKQEKEVAKEILQPIYELCKVRKEITFDDLNFLVMKYGIELE